VLHAMLPVIKSAQQQVSTGNIKRLQGTVTGYLLCNQKLVLNLSNSFPNCRAHRLSLTIIVQVIASSINTVVGWWWVIWYAIGNLEGGQSLRSLSVCAVGQNDL